jgi:hypothetical protein
MRVWWERWASAATRIEATVEMLRSLPARLCPVVRWRPNWWTAAVSWSASSPIAAGLGWWLAALEGCLERVQARLPRWWPEQLTPAALAAVLLVLDVEVWRWLPS